MRTHVSCVKKSTLIRREKSWHQLRDYSTSLSWFELVAVCYSCWCLQAIPGCPGNTDGGWKGECIQKTIKPVAAAGDRDCRLMQKLCSPHTRIQRKHCSHYYLWFIIVCPGFPSPLHLAFLQTLPVSVQLLLLALSHLPFFFFPSARQPWRGRSAIAHF